MEKEAFDIGAEILSAAAEQEFLGEGRNIYDFFGEHKTKILEETEVLRKKYGDSFQNYINTYAEKTERVSTLNKLLLLDESEKTEDEYTNLVTQIVEATRDYYDYISKLPDEIRRFILSITHAIDSTEGAMDELSDILEEKLPNFIRFLPSIQSIRPKKYIMQIDAITNQLTTLGEHNRLKVGKRGNQPIKTTVTLDLPEHMKIEGGAVLSTYDKSIINGITSLLESGNAVFSVPMLYHAMTGKQNPTVDDQLSEEICGKLEKMRRMMISIDLTEENNARYVTDENGDPLDVKDLTIEGYLLPLNKISGMINGKKTELFQTIQTPPLYAYSKMKRQLASVSISLLNAPLNNNSTTIPLKTYLLQRIEMMKNRKNSILSSTILFETIYLELGDQNAGKTRKMRIRTYTTTILDYFVEQKYIAGYESFKKGRTVCGINILL